MSVSKLYCLILVNALIKSTFFFIIGSLLFSIFLWYFAANFNSQILKKNVPALALIKLTLVVSLVTITFSVFILTLFYIIYQHTIATYALTTPLNNFSLFFDYAKIKTNSFVDKHFSVDGFGLVLLNLGIFVGFISLISLDSRFYWKNISFIFLCHVLVGVIYLFCFTNDLISFFILYEALLIPSFLLVHFVSPYRKGIQASLYFVIWTQLGSFLVLSGVVYIIQTTGLIYFIELKAHTFTIKEIYLLYTLFFFGFGFKIPIWPFHHWLTKTHVEAPSGFSIFLSGFLVKSAVFGFYKLSNLLGGQIDTTFFSLFAFMGVLDASYKMWAQTDLKKLVAYGTIQEMSMIYLVLSWGDSTASIGSLIFCITHSFLSALLFYLVDCIQRRYRARNIVQINGLLTNNPNLATAILFTCIVYMGLPGTTKFVTEFYILSGLLEATPYTIILVVFSVNYIGALGFCKAWFNVVFGMSAEKNLPNQGDLSLKEIFIILFCFFNFFFFGQIVGLLMI